MSDYQLLPYTARSFKPFDSVFDVNEVNSVFEKMQARISELGRRGSELAAHVELLANGIGYALEALNTEVANLGTIRSEEIKELEAIKKIVPQTSLAEVRAQQAKESYTAGFCEALNLYVDGLNQDVGMDALNPTHQNTLTKSATEAAMNNLKPYPLWKK